MARKSEHLADECINSGYRAFDLSDWAVVGEYDEADGKHRAYVVPSRDLVIDGVAIRKGERVNIEESYKYNAAQSAELW